MIETEEEVVELFRKQDITRNDTTREAEIVRQITSADPMDLLRPLGIELQGYPATRALIRTVLQLSERVVYIYKDRFLRLRPNAFDTRLRPLIANPPHSAYPSGHSFQMFSVAHVLTRAFAEIPATTEMFHIAQRIGENREYAGVHYATDTEVSRKLAAEFAPYLFHVCRRQMRAAQREWF